MIFSGTVNFNISGYDGTSEQNFLWMHLTRSCCSAILNKESWEFGQNGMGFFWDK